MELQKLHYFIYSMSGLQKTVYCIIQKTVYCIVYRLFCTEDSSEASLQFCLGLAMPYKFNTKNE